MDVGAGDDAVVLHSGWIGTWEDWAPQLSALSRGQRVVAFDHRGVGRTPCETGEFGVDRLAEDLLEVIETLEVGRCVLGGFSTGSQVLQRALSQAPDQFCALILMCPSGDAAPDAAFLDMLRSDFDTAIDMFVQACLPEAVHEDVAAVRKWVAVDWADANGQAVAVLHRGSEVCALLTVDASNAGIGRVLWTLNPAKLARANLRTAK
ncbi:MAG TPA: alpha/beta fold hydrolase [Jatrophihabitantaceae bacterium]|jgi:pimeloyl-ACP methyl ester carboxylesterase|nr:alpha/beta fold hydrolase [Jatrophihabitantaceae bacterium]